MNFVKALVCVVLLCVIDQGRAEDRSKVFFGLREVAPNTYPWVAWLKIGIKRVKCGATLIASDKVLTAASCAGADINTVLLGDHSRSDTDGKEQEFSITSTVVHPDYKALTQEYDVAVLMLDRNVTADNSVQPIPLLPNDRITDRVLGKHCRVVGWGYEVSGSTDLVRDQSDVLMEVTVDMIDNTTCTAAGAPTSTAICYEPFRDPTALTCEGDAGGAYMCKRKGVWTLSGVMSNWNVGEGCIDGARAVTTIPSVVDWINTQI